MKSFSPLSGSEGPRREFKITWGLRVGYGKTGRIYDLEKAIRAAHCWMRERHAGGEPFLSGMFTRGEVVYAGSEGDAAHDREPVAIFAGEVLPLYAGDLDDETVRMLLNELASEIGRTLEQAEVHVGSTSHLHVKGLPVTGRRSAKRTSFLYNVDCEVRGRV
jgi:hypothetical protein